jgi:hypothetical protein
MEGAVMAKWSFWIIGVLLCAGITYGAFNYNPDKLDAFGKDIVIGNPVAVGSYGELECATDVFTEYTPRPRMLLGRPDQESRIVAIVGNEKDILEETFEEPSSNSTWFDKYLHRTYTGKKFFFAYDGEIMLGGNGVGGGSCELNSANENAIRAEIEKR